MRYEIYHSDEKGKSIWAGSRTRKESAIKLAEKIELAEGQRITVIKDGGPCPMDCKVVYKRTTI